MWSTGMSTPSAAKILVALKATVNKNVNSHEILVALNDMIDVN